MKAHEVLDQLGKRPEAVEAARLANWYAQLYERADDELTAARAAVNHGLARSFTPGASLAQILGPVYLGLKGLKDPAERAVVHLVVARILAATGRPLLTVLAAGHCREAEAELRHPAQK